MREYSNIISLSKNSRGVYSLDPSIGCKSGMEANKNGCFNDCYAARIARIYGYDFSKTQFRYFESNKQVELIKKQISKIKLPFIRMGTMGDPSENWEHTISICEKIQANYQTNLFTDAIKEIVIITKHWTKLSYEQCERIKKLKICINTSVSALDSIDNLNYLINQYEILKKYCNSVLRIVSFDFNEENEKGKMYSDVQKWLFQYRPLDTVFRASKNNELVKQGIIKIKKTKFLGKNTIISKYNKNTFFGKCDNCIELCGLNMSKDKSKLITNDNRI